MFNPIRYLTAALCVPYLSVSLFDSVVQFSYVSAAEKDRSQADISQSIHRLMQEQPLGTIREWSGSTGKELAFLLYDVPK